MSQITDIENNPRPDSYLIPVELISAYNKNRERLINNNDESYSYTLDSNFLKFSLVDPIYITKIVLTAEESLKNIDIKTTGFLNNKKNTVSGKPVDTENVSVFIVNRYCSKFEFRGRFLREINLKKVEVYGFLPKDLEQIDEAFSYYDNQIEKTNRIISSEKQNIESREEALESDKQDFESYKQGLEESIKNNESRKNELEEEIEVLDEQLETRNRKLENINQQVTSREDRVKELKAEEDNIKNSIQQRNSESAKLNDKITELKEELRKLQSDKSLFTDEIQSYTKESRRNIWVYFFLCLAPWFIIVFVAYELFYGAVDLTYVVKSNENVDIWDLVISRLPFVVVAAFLIETSFRFSVMFFNRIISVHNDRMNLSKMSIVAKDISEAEAAGLENLSDEHIFNARTQVKMQMIKSYLSKGLNSSIEFNPDKKRELMEKALNAFKITKKKDSDEEGAD